MAANTKANYFYPEIFEETVKGAWPNLKALHGTGAAVVNTSMPWGGDRVGEVVKVPYFGSLGELEDVASDGDELTPARLSQSVEEALVQHSGKAFEITKWGADGMGDPYEESARQMVEATERRIDRALIAQAMTTPLVKDDSSKTFSYDLMVDGLSLFGDDLDDVALLGVSSKTLGDLYKLKDGFDRPLLTDPVAGGLRQFLGVPLVVSDRLASSAFGTVTATGTTPPDITVTGTPTSAGYKFVIQCTKAGALGTSEIKWSSDGGISFEGPVATAAAMVLGDTGATIAIAAGSMSTNNKWTFESAGTHTSLLCKRGSLVAWINGSPSVDTDKNILKDSKLAAVHVYWVAHRYKRLPGSNRPGVVALKHK